MEGWRTSMEDAHAAFPNLDDSTSFFGVYDGHGGKVVAKLCAKYLHREMLRHDAYAAGDIGKVVPKAYLRMDEMMHGQRGWREPTILVMKSNNFKELVTKIVPVNLVNSRFPT